MFLLNGQILVEMPKFGDFLKNPFEKIKLNTNKFNRIILVSFKDNIKSEFIKLINFFENGL